MAIPTSAWASAGASLTLAALSLGRTSAKYSFRPTWYDTHSAVALLSPVSIMQRMFIALCSRRKPGLTTWTSLPSTVPRAPSPGMLLKFSTGSL